MRPEGLFPSQEVMGKRDKQVEALLQGHHQQGFVNLQSERDTRYCKHPDTPHIPFIGALLYRRAHTVQAQSDDNGYGADGH